MSNKTSAIDRRIKAYLDNKHLDFATRVRAADLDPARAFTYARLSKQNFSGCDLSGFNFTGAYLQGSRFDDAKLGDAIFTATSVDISALSLARDWGDQGARIVREIAQRPRGRVEPRASSPPSPRVIVVGASLSLRGALKPLAPVLGVEFYWLRDKDLEPKAGHRQLMFEGDFLVVFDRPRAATEGDWLARAHAVKALMPDDRDLPFALFWETAGEGVSDAHLEIYSPTELTFLPDIREQIFVVFPALVRFFTGHRRRALPPSHPGPAELEDLFSLPLLPRLDIEHFSRQILNTQPSRGISAQVLDILDRFREFGARFDKDAGRMREDVALELEVLAQSLLHNTGATLIEGYTRHGMCAMRLAAVACLLETRRRKNCVRAFDILSDISAEARPYPMFWFRVAQARILAANLELDEGLTPLDDVDEALRRCWGALEYCRTLKPDIRAVLIAATEYDYLRDVVPALWAYHAWDASQEEDMEREHRFEEAVEFVGDVGRAWEKEATTAGLLNVAIYLSLLARLTVEMDVGPEVERGLRNALARVLHRLERKANALDDCHWEALAYGGVSLGQMTKARRAAAQYLKVRALQAGSMDHLGMDDGVLHALDILREG